MALLPSFCPSVEPRRTKLGCQQAEKPHAYDNECGRSWRDNSGKYRGCPTATHSYGERHEFSCSLPFGCGDCVHPFRLNRLSGRAPHRDLSVQGFLEQSQPFRIRQIRPSNYQGFDGLPKIQRVLKGIFQFRTAFFVFSHGGAPDVGVCTVSPKYNVAPTKAIASNCHARGGFQAGVAPLSVIAATRKSKRGRGRADAHFHVAMDPRLWTVDATWSDDVRISVRCHRCGADAWGGRSGRHTLQPTVFEVIAYASDSDVHSDPPGQAPQSHNW